jgi:hypothetical protein
MADRFGSTVLQEAGEAIGNVGVGSFDGDGGTWVSKRWHAGWRRYPCPRSAAAGPRAPHPMKV